MITIKELKTFLATLPIEFDEFNMSNGEFGRVESEEGFYYRLDKPIITLYVDENSKELCFLHQSQEEIDKIQAEIEKDAEKNETGAE